jgi:hypothetical protein
MVAEADSAKSPISGAVMLDTAVMPLLAKKATVTGLEASSFESTTSLPFWSSQAVTTALIVAGVAAAVAAILIDAVVPAFKFAPAAAVRMVAELLAAPAAPAAAAAAVLPAATPTVPTERLAPGFATENFRVAAAAFEIVLPTTAARAN